MHIFLLSLVSMTTVVELHSKSACHGMKANIKLAFQFCGYTSPGLKLLCSL